MFTGIVRQVAPVVHVRAHSSGARIGIDLGALAEESARGDSICVSGACLTVSGKTGTVCEFDVVAETLCRTTIGRLRPGDRVNIEPSLRVGDPLGGHFVLGHVDGVGVIAAPPGGTPAVLRVSIDPALTSEMVGKASVAVDGVSLTLVEVLRDGFTCALIPTTLQDTTLGLRRPGDTVNIETDILGKLVARYLARIGPASGLSMDKLRSAGFAP